MGLSSYRYSKISIFRLDALVLSEIATGTWLAGWLAVCHSRYCIKTTKPILKLFRPSDRDVVLGTCTCTRVQLKYRFQVLVLVLVLATLYSYLYSYLELFSE